MKTFGIDHPAEIIQRAVLPIEQKNYHAAQAEDIAELK
jgi:hypothetical protein